MKYPTHIPTKRLYVGKKRLCHPFISYDEPLLRWACSVKPGDYIATCEGMNRKVAEVVPEWRNHGFYTSDKRNSHWFLQEIRFTDTRERWHYCPGGGCALPKESPETVTVYQTGWAKWILSEESAWYKDDEAAKKHAELLLSYVEQGKAIVDCYGELIPELMRSGA